MTQTQTQTQTMTLLRSLPHCLLRPAAFAAACLSAGLACAQAQPQSQPQPLEPKHLFSSSVLNFYSPDEAGWQVTGAARNGIALGKRGSGNNETFGAQAVVFEMPALNTEPELVDFVTQRIGAMNPAPRFHLLSSDYRYTEVRGYPCVDVRVAFDDTAAATPMGPVELKLQVIALYCRHPAQTGLGFFGAYSRRGEGLVADLEAPAAAYLQGVGVPRPQN